MPERLPLAIGDIHGHIEVLQAALRRFSQEPLVFLGDLTDRGPASPEVVGCVRGLVEAGRAQLCLGNHDQMLIDVVLGGQDSAFWRSNGGDSTLAQYAASERSLEDDAAWLRDNAQPFICIGHVLYSHAMRPSEHDPEAHIWGRPSTTPVYPLPTGLRLSVHGHTPMELCPVGIALQDGSAVWFIDTGAVWSGELCVFDPACHKAYLVKSEPLPAPNDTEREAAPNASP